MSLFEGIEEAWYINFPISLSVTKYLAKAT